MTETSRKTNLEFGVQNNTKAGLNEIKQGVASVGEAVAQASVKAGAAFDGMGKSSDGAATKIDKSTQGIIRSIEREVAAMEAGGKSTAAYYESIAKQRGADMNALGPYLQQMRLAEKQAEQALGTMGMSAKQTAAAMRGVPAQFTDIFVSLQGGQAPLTVFLQQGGQLKDMFGGAGNAAKALGSYVLGLVNPFTVAAAAVVALGAAYYQGSQEQDAFVKAIVLSGNASGMTSTQLQLLAADLGVVVGSQGRAAEALTEFVRAGVQGSDSLKEYAQAAIDWEKATGTAVADTAKAFAKLQEDPLKAALELHKGMNFLTTATYEQIRALEEQGDKQAAAKVASDAYKDAINAGANQIKDNLGYLEGAWRKLGNTASKVWDLMLGAGRAATVADKMGGLRDDIAAMEKQLAEGKGFGNTAGGAATGRGNSALTQQDLKLLQERITLRKQELSTLEQTAKAEKEAAEQKAKEGELVTAREEWRQRGLKFLTDEQKLTRALKEERQAGIKAGASEEEISKRLDAVRESMTKKTKGLSAAERARNKELSDQQKLIGELSGLSSTFTKDWNDLSKAYARGALSLSQLEKAQAALLAKQPFAVALAKEEAEATKARVKAYEEEVKAQDKLLKQRQDAAQKAQEAVQKARDEEEAYAYAAAAGITLAEAVAHIALARAEENYQKGLAQGLDAQTLLALQQERDARRELIDVMAQKGVREANKKAQDQITKDWEKLSETVGRTLADYIMGGGKDAATYLKRLFSTLVLQPVVQYGAQGAMAALGMGKTGASLPGNGLTDWSTWGVKASDFLFDQGVGMSLKGFESLGSSMQSLGVTVGRVDAWLKDIPGMSGGIGSGAGYLGSIYSLTQGNYGSALGSAIGTWALPGIGTMLGGMLGGLFDGLDDSGTPHMGGSAMWSAATGGKTNLDLLNTSKTDNPLSNIDNQFGSGFGWVEDRAEVRDVLGVLAQGMGSSLDSFAKSFGSAFGYEVALGFADDTSKDGSWGALRIALGGQDVVNWNDNRESKWAPRSFSDGEEGYKQYLSAVFLDVKTALLGMDLPAWADQILDASSDIDTINAALQQIGATQLIFDQLGQSMQMFSGISGDLQTQLLMASGGIESLSANAGTFYQGFFDESERMEALNQQLRDALSGLDLSIDPAMGEAAKRQYREAVEAARAGGQGELVAQLLAMSGTFATAADAAQKSLSDMADAALESAAAAEALSQNLRSSLTSLEAQFSGGGFARQYQAEDAAKTVQQLLGDVGISKDLGALTQTLLSATSADVESYFREIWNVLDADEARLELVEITDALLNLAQASDEAAQAAADAAAAIASERSGLEQRWLQAIGDTAEMRRRELEALDPSNRALLEMIYGLEDAKQSMTDLTTAAQAAAQKAAAAWQGWGTAAGLGAQYLGDTSGLEARRAILNAQINASTDPAERLSKLQELISIEQSIGQAQQASRKTELDAINARQQALQKEISAAQQLLSAAKSLGDYAHSLQFGATSGLSDTDRLAALGGEYSSLIGKARGGDADALKQLQGVSGDYLGLAQTLAASGSDYSVLSGRMAAEMEALAKAQELVAQSQVTGYEAQIAQLTQQSDLLSAQVELTDSTKSLIAKSMIDQAEAWDRESTQALTLQELQQRATDSLALMPDGIARALRPALDSNASYLASSIGGTVSSALRSLAEMLGMDGSHATGLSYVPFDGYRAELHRGERVLTAQENRAYSAPQQFVMQATGIGTARLEALVERQTQYIAKLESRLAAIEVNTGGLYDLTDQKSEGGNADRVEMMNVREMAQAIAQAIKEPIKETA